MVWRKVLRVSRDFRKGCENVAGRVGLPVVRGAVGDITRAYIFWTALLNCALTSRIRRIDGLFNDHLRKSLQHAIDPLKGLPSQSQQLHIPEW